MAKQYPPKKDPNIDLSQYIFGKVMPQDIPTEEATIGALITEKDALGKIIDIIQPETFYLDAHQHIYKAILELHKNRFPVDILSVVDALKKAGDLEKIGGAYYLTELANRVGSSANIEYHARILAQKRMQRQIVGIASGALQDAYNDMVDPFEHLSSIMSDLAKVNPSIVGNIEPISTVAMKWLKDIEERSSNPDAGKGVMSGIHELDKLIGGFMPGNLIVVGARPGMGKSALVNSLSMNMGAAHKKVMVFSMEMTKSELANRLISAISGVTLSDLKDPSRLNPTQWQALQTAIEIVQQYQILYSDVSAMKPMMIRKEIERHNPDIVFIDYLGLMNPDFEKRNGTTNDTITSISKELKSIAKDFSVPVIVLSQLSRAVETRGGNKRPQLSDLRDSGCLAAETRVMMADGSLVPIKELVGQTGQVTAMDGWFAGAFGMTKAWETGTRQLYKMTLASGRTIRATSNHKFLKYEGYKPLEELAAGDRIAILRSQPYFGNGNLTNAQLAFLGHMIGDGCMLQNHVIQYTSGDKDCIDFMSTTTEQLFGITTKIVDGKNCQVVYMSAKANKWHKNPIAIWLGELGLYNKRSKEKFVPLEVFKCDKDKICRFLRHLWATDGTICLPKNDYPAIAYSTNSPQLAADVQELLMRVGIRSKISQTTKKGYSPSLFISISGRSNMILFLKKIGAFGKKEPIANQMMSILEDLNENTNTDTIPREVWDAVSAIAEGKKFSAAKKKDLIGLRESTPMFCPSREMLSKYANELESDELLMIANSDIYWDKIISIEPDAIEPVYDITVDKVHNFVANGIITHNSVEQDADVVIFLYRPEYYQILEDEQGNSLKNLAEIIVAKQRNGALDTVKCTFSGPTTQFLGLADNPHYIYSPIKRQNDEDIAF